MKVCIHSSKILYKQEDKKIIEKECTAMLLAAYDAATKANLAVFPLYESYFYELLYCCKNKYSDEDKGAKKR